MKHKYILIACAIISTQFGAQAQQVLEDNYTRLRVHYEVPALRFDATDVQGEKLVYPVLEGYMLGGEIGSPTVPYLSSLLTVPFCDGYEVSVDNAVFDTLDLPLPDVLPQQAPRSKSDTTALVLFRDKEVYATDAYSGLPLASVAHAGVARDRNLAHLHFAPVRVNPVSGKAIVCRRADVTVRYINPDRDATIGHYERYHTPAFNAGQSLNSLSLGSKSGSSAPVRMSIVSHTSLDCRRLHAFADWKRRQGMMVDIITTDRTGTGARDEIATQLQALFDNATAAEPAPTYILVVGDNEQLRAFSSNINSWGMNDHVTDLYFASWTSGDQLPDAYYGRFSATDTLTLARIINKTMLYESYAFDDDSYLARAVLVSGIDQGSQGDNAYGYSDPTMDYIAQQYVTADQGFGDVRYYKNRTSYAPTGVTVSGSSAMSGITDTLRNLYDQGFGWINYSAHGDWNEWSIPRFNVNNANNMQNAGMPSVMIGNCCLSNKFNKDVCFGEALLRRADNAGAVAYIGASQETYWTHDFWWAVGLRGDSEISGTSVPVYNANRLGTYDHLFHTHGETLDQRASTVGSMIYYGNMAVQGASGSGASLYAHYYWEIYHVMGDPSLMPWLGRADKMPFSIDTTSTATLRFTTVPGAYVALVDSATLDIIGSTWADATGYGEISRTQSSSLAASFISATAQGYRPYISNADSVDLGLNVQVRSYPNPATTQLNIVGSGLREITVARPNGAVVATYTVSADAYTLDLSGIDPGLYIVVIASDDGVTAQRLVRL